MSASPEDRSVVGDDYDEMDEGQGGERKWRETMESMQAIEEEFSALKDRLYKEKLVELEEEMDQLKNGMHLDLLYYIQVLDQKRTERIKAAELYRRYQIENINAQYLFDKREAESSFQESKQEHYHTLLKILQEKRQKLEEEKTVMDISSISDDTGKGNKRRSGRNKDAENPEKKKKKNQSITGPLIVYGLKEAEILEDLASIRKGKAGAPRKTGTKKAKANGSS
eukprot:Clim_evm41s229 gene=Clim_evmTU41s229